MKKAIKLQIMRSFSVMAFKYRQHIMGMLCTDTKSHTKQGLHSYRRNSLMLNGTESKKKKSRKSIQQEQQDALNKNEDSFVDHSQNPGHCLEDKQCVEAETENINISQPVVENEHYDNGNKIDVGEARRASLEEEIEKNEPKGLDDTPKSKIDCTLIDQDNDMDATEQQISLLPNVYQKANNESVVHANVLPCQASIDSSLLPEVSTNYTHEPESIIASCAICLEENRFRNDVYGENNKKIQACCNKEANTRETSVHMNQRIDDTNLPEKTSSPRECLLNYSEDNNNQPGDMTEETNQEPCGCTDNPPEELASNDLLAEGKDIHVTEDNLKQSVEHLIVQHETQDNHIEQKDKELADSIFNQDLKNWNVPSNGLADENISCCENLWIQRPSAVEFIVKDNQGTETTKIPCKEPISSATASIYDSQNPNSCLNEEGANNSQVKTIFSKDSNQVCDERMVFLCEKYAEIKMATEYHQSCTLQNSNEPNHRGENEATDFIVKRLCTAQPEGFSEDRRCLEALSEPETENQSQSKQIEEEKTSETVKANVLGATSHPEYELRNEIHEAKNLNQTIFNHNAPENIIGSAIPITNQSNPEKHETAQVNTWVSSPLHISAIPTRECSVDLFPGTPRNISVEENSAENLSEAPHEVESFLNSSFGVGTLNNHVPKNLLDLEENYLNSEGVRCETNSSRLLNINTTIDEGTLSDVPRMPSTRIRHFTAKNKNTTSENATRLRALEGALPCVNTIGLGVEELFTSIIYFQELFMNIKHLFDCIHSEYIKQGKDLERIIKEKDVLLSSHEAAKSSLTEILGYGIIERSKELSNKISDMTNITLACVMEKIQRIDQISSEIIARNSHRSQEQENALKERENELSHKNLTIAEQSRELLAQQESLDYLHKAAEQFKEQKELYRKTMDYIRSEHISLSGLYKSIKELVSAIIFNTDQQNIAIVLLAKDINDTLCNVRHQITDLSDRLVHGLTSVSDSLRLLSDQHFTKVKSNENEISLLKETVLNRTEESKKNELRVVELCSKNDALGETVKDLKESLELKDAYISDLEKQLQEALNSIRVYEDQLIQSDELIKSLKEKNKSTVDSASEIAKAQKAFFKENAMLKLRIEELELLLEDKK